MDPCKEMKVALTGPDAAMIRITGDISAPPALDGRSDFYEVSFEDEDAYIHFSDGTIVEAVVDEDGVRRFEVIEYGTSTRIDQKVVGYNTITRKPQDEILKLVGDWDAIAFWHAAFGPSDEDKIELFQKIVDGDLEVRPAYLTELVRYFHQVPLVVELAKAEDDADVDPVITHTRTRLVEIHEYWCSHCQSWFDMEGLSDSRRIECPRCGIAR